MKEERRRGQLDNRRFDEHLYKHRFSTTMAVRRRELLPGTRVRIDERADIRVTILLEGLNFDVPKERFTERFASFKDNRYG